MECGNDTFLGLESLRRHPSAILFKQPCAGPCDGIGLVALRLRDYLADRSWAEVPLETKIEIARAMEELADANKEELKAEAKRAADLKCTLGGAAECPCGGGEYRPICGFDRGIYGSGWRYADGQCTNLY